MSRITRFVVDENSEDDILENNEDILEDDENMTEEDIMETYTLTEESDIEVEGGTCPCQLKLHGGHDGNDNVEEIFGRFDEIVSSYVGGGFKKEEFHVYKDLADLLKEINDASSEKYETIDLKLPHSYKKVRSSKK